MRAIVVGTAGHIDHGKSALVRALTGIDPDRLKEEQERGITIDLGFAHLEEPDLTVAFVDVPGHERFVKNMLAGVGGIDLVLLVVAADESVMPQTREHFQICRLLGVPSGVIVLTKADLVDADMIDLARLEVRELVAGSFLEGAPIVPVSSKTGAGLDELREALRVGAAGVRARSHAGPLRLPVDRVFSVKGFGTVVTGTLVSGAIREDQDVVVLPGGPRVKVRGLQVHGVRQQAVGAGHRVAVNLGGAELAEVVRGHTLAVADAFEVTRRFDAVVEAVPGGRPIKHGSRVRFHHGTAERLGRIALAGARADGRPLGEVPMGTAVYARIRLEGPAVLTRGDRFIIRAYSPALTIGGGVVIDPAPPSSAIRTEAGWTRLRRLDAVDGGEPGVDAAISGFLEERGIRGLSRMALVSRAGLTAADATAAAARLAAQGQATIVGEFLLAPAALAAVATRLLGLLAAHHAAEPLSDGLPRQEARERVFAHAAPEVFEHVLADLVATQRIVARDRLTLAGHQVSLSAEEARAHDALTRVYREAGLTPPDAAAAAAAAGVTPGLADRMVTLLMRQKTLLKIDALLFHAGALERLRSEVRALKTGATAPVVVDVAAFKARYGVTRKYAIPLLEYLDREKVTRRVGEGRVVL